jgi:IS4 transposase
MGLYKRTKNNNKPVIRQVLDLIPRHLLRKSIDNHKSDKWCHKYFTYDQLVATMFGQLNKCQSLEDISAGISVNETFISDLGLEQSPARSTMSDGNKKRNYKVYENLYLSLLRHYSQVLKPKHNTHIIKEIEHKTVKIIDSSTISLCLSLFDWAKFRTAKGGVKIHVRWDESLMLPDLINITEAKTHDRYGFDNMIFPKGTIIVEDKAYFDFELMRSRALAKNIFVTRIKENTVYEVIEELELPENEDQHILIDELIKLTSPKAVKTKIANHVLRRVVAYDEKNNTTIEIITNNLNWKASTIAQLYRNRWDIELFFKALKQNLQVKTFIGTSENAVKAQIFIAMICFLLLELMRRNICKGNVGFSNFCERIRICLTYYLTLSYICNNVGQGAHRVKVRNKSLFDGTPDLFSG